MAAPPMQSRFSPGNKTFLNDKGGGKENETEPQIRFEDSFSQPPHLGSCIGVLAWWDRKVGGALEGFFKL